MRRAERISLVTEIRKELLKCVEGLEHAEFNTEADIMKTYGALSKINNIVEKFYQE